MNRVPHNHYTHNVILAALVVTHLITLHAVLTPAVERASGAVSRPESPEPAQPHTTTPPRPDSRFWRAIWQIESRGRLDPPAGDGGASIGPLQIQKAYWQDGCRFLGVDWPYSDARNLKKAVRVATAYVVHYQRHGGYPPTWETWAKIHNGGPRGPEKRATAGYWRRVSAKLN